MKYITVVPAYGKDYKNGKEVQEAWDSGKDFLIQDISSTDDGRYINKQDAEREGDMTLNIRYKKLANIKPIKVKKK